jgi:hypothetical protein
MSMQWHAVNLVTAGCLAVDVVLSATLRFKVKIAALDLSAALAAIHRSVLLLLG